MKQLLIFSTIVFYFFSCNNKHGCEDAIDVSKVNTDTKVIRLEKDLFKAASSQDVAAVLKRYPLAAKYIFGINPSDSLPVSDLFHFYTQPGLKEFYENGEKVNQGFPDLAPALKDFMKHVRYYYPSFTVPEIYTFVSGLPPAAPGAPTPDIVFPDSANQIIGIGIDYFYGEKSLRPKEYKYMLDRRKSYFIVPSVGLKLAQKEFVYYDVNDRTMLGEMIKWGKAYYFVERMMPCAPDSIIAGYTTQQTQDVENNLDIIWGHFIKHELFYKTDLHEIQRYLGESPKVVAIGEKCPGRIGRYLGWQIVKTYMEKNPKETLEQLMKEPDAQKIFRLSKYKPKAK